MEKKKIFVIENDPASLQLIRESLPDYEITSAHDVDQALPQLGSSLPQAIIFDSDPDGERGLIDFRRIKQAAPGINVVMLSSSNDIPLAVRAAKLGVADFIKKPFVEKQLYSLIGDLMAPRAETVLETPEAIWLRGSSATARQFLQQIEAVLDSRNLILCAEIGINKGEVVRYIHTRLRKRSKMVRLDLESFRRENLETHFWMTLQELMAEPDLSKIRNEEDLCGTLFLDRVDRMDSNFQKSLFEFLQNRRGKLDREVMVVVGSQQKIEGYSLIEVPPLRQRKEDLPFLCRHFLEKYSLLHNRGIRGLSLAVLSFLDEYDFPGNYVELERLMEQAVLAAGSGMIDLQDVMLNFDQWSRIITNLIVREGKIVFSEATRQFEAEIYRVLQKKTGGDVAAMARFMDIPRTVLIDRLADLGLPQQEIHA